MNGGRRARTQYRARPQRNVAAFAQHMIDKVARDKDIANRVGDTPCGSLAGGNVRVDMGDGRRQRQHAPRDEPQPLEVDFDKAVDVAGLCGRGLRDDDVYGCSRQCDGDVAEHDRIAQMSTHNRPGFAARADGFIENEKQTRTQRELGQVGGTGGRRARLSSSRLWGRNDDRAGGLRHKEDHSGGTSRRRYQSSRANSVSSLFSLGSRAGLQLRHACLLR